MFGRNSASLLTGLIFFVSVCVLPASANPISPFSDHSSEDHSNESHAGEYLEGVDLTISDLSGSNFSSSDLTDALLDGADLSNLNLVGANLSGASITGADASASDFSGANFSGADLTATDVSATIFTGGFYDLFTIFEAGFDPVAEGMNLIPEPSSAALLALGLLGLGACRRGASRANPRV